MSARESRHTDVQDLLPEYVPEYEDVNLEGVVLILERQLWDLLIPSVSSGRKLRMHVQWNVHGDSEINIVKPERSE